ncbi:N-acyl homoserine lactonase family protein [Microbacterium marinilacus]|uniref:N-acyl homoserine lactonase family protein n=1 Tax=Microbacterium marinilacus TaxID=415209 RepID=A0ABP7BMP2_9MICO|nr:N-acyl homoserine lactonase family protein [Microbacterium marinilacus]MBY0689722.1 N-acyl homoserine lactonase family protein [Microbacterium marinilacus]
MTNRITIVQYGTRQGTKSDVYLNWPIYGRPDEPIGMDYFFWLVDTGEQTIVVDTGFSAAGGANRARTFLVQPREAFAALGVDPASSPEVLVTHAHYDHIGNLDLFPSSRVTMARAEWEFWASGMATRRQFHHSVEDAELAELRRIEGQGRLRVFDDEAEIAPGVRMVRVGGHTPGQSVVLVDTADGRVALASDAVHYYEEYEDDVPFAFVADLPAMYAGFDLLHRWEEDGTVRHVVSGHDPSTLDRFGRIADGPLPGLTARIG